jgi:Thioesterase superfamily
LSEPSGADGPARSERGPSGPAPQAPRAGALSEPLSAFGYPDADAHVTDARIRLAVSARDLIDALMTAHSVDDDALDAAAAQLDAVTAALRDEHAAARTEMPHSARGHRDYVPRSPLVGVVSPLSPAATWEHRDGVLEILCTFGRPYEGPPGAVHGGFVALAFDELLGMVIALNTEGGLTGRLTIRYRALTPLYEPLRLTAWVDHREGRRMTARGTIHAGDRLTAEAEGLFVRPQGR